jgi:hypothetical protein
MFGERETIYRGWVVRLTVNSVTATVKATNGGCEIEHTTQAKTRQGIEKALLAARTDIDKHPLTLSLQR